MLIRASLKEQLLAELKFVVAQIRLQNLMYYLRQWPSGRAHNSTIGSTYCAVGITNLKPMSLKPEHNGNVLVGDTIERTKRMPSRIGSHGPEAKYSA